jgi:hypothetical protein
MTPLILFVPFGGQGVIGAVFRLTRMFRVINLFHRSLKILEGRRLLYIIIFVSMAIT